MKKFVALICSLAVLSSMTGCSTIASMTAGVNWWALGANICFKLSDTLNKKAEKKEKEIEELKNNNNVQNVTEETNNEEVKENGL